MNEKWRWIPLSMESITKLYRIILFLDIVYIQVLFCKVTFIQAWLFQSKSLHAINTVQAFILLPHSKSKWLIYATFTCICNKNSTQEIPLPTKYKDNNGKSSRLFPFPNARSILLLFWRQSLYLSSISFCNFSCKSTYTRLRPSKADSAFSIPWARVFNTFIYEYSGVWTARRYGRHN